MEYRRHNTENHNNNSEIDEKYENNKVFKYRVYGFYGIILTFSRLKCDFQVILISCDK